MSGKLRPIRLLLARVVYWLIWGPAVGMVIPFFLVARFVDWLSWKAFPRIGDFAQPAWSFTHTLALRLGNAVLGYDPSKVPTP